MIYEGELHCPNCSGWLRLYDHVMRIVKTKIYLHKTNEVPKMRKNT